LRKTRSKSDSKVGYPAWGNPRRFQPEVNWRRNNADDTERGKINPRLSGFIRVRLIEVLCQFTNISAMIANTNSMALRSMSQADIAWLVTKCGGENIKRKISNFFAEAAARLLPACPSHPAVRARVGIARTAGIEYLWGRT